MKEYLESSDGHSQSYEFSGVGMFRPFCSRTGMFPLPSHMSHVSSTAVAQARLRTGSGPLRSALIINHQLNEGPEKAPPPARDPKYVTTILFN